MKGLSGLARLALPKGVSVGEDSKFNTISDELTSIEESRRINVFADYAVTLVSRLVDWVKKVSANNQQNKFKTKFYYLLQEYHDCANDEAKLNYLKAQPLGFWAFTTEAFRFHGECLFFFFFSEYLLHFLQTILSMNWSLT